MNKRVTQEIKLRIIRKGVLGERNYEPGSVGEQNAPGQERHIRHSPYPRIRSTPIGTKKK